jgi:hypothetical protein
MRPFATAVCLLLICIVACTAQTTGNDCARLKEPIQAASIALPSGGATIDSAELMAPAPLSAAQLPFGPLPPYLAVVPAAPEYCKVLGAIAPVDPKAPLIRFEVNLPTEWNGSSVQFGGGGFNGVLITGLGLPPRAPADRPSPLARGFVTYGTDSGHQNAAGVPLQALRSTTRVSPTSPMRRIKKVRDVAVVLMQRRYGRAPAKRYYVGFSEGGREGLTMAQRFPADFDGIFSGVPVINWVGLQAVGTRVGLAQLEDGWIGPEKVKLVNDAVIAACDRLDGLADGIVSNYEGCKLVFDVSRLACAPGVSTGVPFGRPARGREGDARAIRVQFCAGERGAQLSGLGARWGERARHRPSWRLGGLADWNRCANVATRPDQQPRLALRQRDGAVLFRARSEIRRDQIRSITIRRPRARSFSPNGCHQR